MGDTVPSSTRTSQGLEAEGRGAAGEKKEGPCSTNAVMMMLIEHEILYCGQVYCIIPFRTIMPPVSHLSSQLPHDAIKQFASC